MNLKVAIYTIVAFLMIAVIMLFIPRRGYSVDLNTSEYLCRKDVCYLIVRKKITKIRVLLEKDI